jgi:hypothetical protein
MSSSTKPRPDDEEIYEEDDVEIEEDRGDLVVDYMKIDFTSTDESVAVKLRNISQGTNEEAEEEFEDEWEFYRGSDPLTNDDLSDIIEFITEIGTAFPLNYLTNILEILNAMLKDPKEYAMDDIRLLWESEPDGESAVVTPIVIENLALKKALSGFLKQTNVNYR